MPRVHAHGRAWTFENVLLHPLVLPVLRLYDSCNLWPLAIAPAPPQARARMHPHPRAPARNHVRLEPVAGGRAVAPPRPGSHAMMGPPPGHLPRVHAVGVVVRPHLTLVLLRRRYKWDRPGACARASCAHAHLRTCGQRMPVDGATDRLSRRPVGAQRKPVDRATANRLGRRPIR